MHKDHFVDTRLERVPPAFFVAAMTFTCIRVFLWAFCVCNCYRVFVMLYFVFVMECDMIASFWWLFLRVFFGQESGVFGKIFKDRNLKDFECLKKKWKSWLKLKDFESLKNWKISRVWKIERFREFGKNKNTGWNWEI
jgi:hypothetical protein